MSPPRRATLAREKWESVTPKPHRYDRYWLLPLLVTVSTWLILKLFSDASNQQLLTHRIQISWARSRENWRALTCRRRVTVCRVKRSCPEEKPPSASALHPGTVLPSALDLWGYSELPLAE